MRSKRNDENADKFKSLNTSRSRRVTGPRANARRQSTQRGEQQPVGGSLPRLAPELCGRKPGVHGALRSQGTPRTPSRAAGVAAGAVNPLRSGPPLRSESRRLPNCIVAPGKTCGLRAEMLRLARLVPPG